MNLCKRVLHTAILAAFIGFVSGGAWAQDSLTGSISGTISDSTGAVIPGATVTLTNTDRGQDLRVLRTSGGGYFTATSLPLGTYTVKVTNPGFKTETVTGLVLHAADALTVNRTLITGSVSEVITVTAAEAQLNLENATSQSLINGEQLNELVLITRNYESLMNLQPGVAFGGATDDLTRGPAGLSGASSDRSGETHG